MKPPKLTSHTAIERALDRADIGARLLVVFKDLTYIDWLAGEGEGSAQATRHAGGLQV